MNQVQEYGTKASTPLSLDTLAGVASATQDYQKEAYSALYRIRRALRGNIPETASDNPPMGEGIIELSNELRRKAGDITAIALEIEKLLGDI